LKETLKDAEGAEVVLAKIAEMSDFDRAMAERVHATVMKAAPGLAPRTWYGMPAYAKDGKGRVPLSGRGEVQGVLRDDRLQRQGEPRRGNMWATAFVLTKLTKADEKRIAELVKPAVS
jgi:hypothetical protein